MFLHVLFQVLSKPEYHSELRREVDQVVAEYGWGVEALTRMVKVDSFVKETGRCIGVMSGQSYVFYKDAALILFLNRIYSAYGNGGFHVFRWNGHTEGYCGFHTLQSYSS